MVGPYRARAEYAGGLGSQSVMRSPLKHFIDLLLLLLYPSTLDGEGLMVSAY